MPNNSPTITSPNLHTGHTRLGFRSATLGILFSSASLAMAFTHPDAPKRDASARADLSMADRKALIMRESLAILRDGIRENMREIRPGGGDLDAIASDIYAHHRIIGLGEASHGIADVFTMRADLFKSLVRCGARDLVIELSVAGAEYLDDYVRGKIPGNVGMAEVMDRSRIYGVWKVQEVADLILWIRTFNAQHPADPIRIHGIDNQRPDTRRLLDLLATKQPGFDAKGMEARDTVYTAACGKMQAALLASPVLKEVPGSEMDKVFTDRQAFVGELRSMLSGIQLGGRERKVAELELRALDQDSEALRQVLIGSRLFRTLNELIGFVSAGKVRDSFMAENFAFTERNIIATSAKIIVWAHSGHLSRRPAYDLDSSPAISPNGATLYPLGVSLAHWYGSDYHVMNITAGGGTTCGTDGTDADAKGSRPVPFSVKADSVEGLVASAGAKNVVFFKTDTLPMQEMMINYLSIGTEFTSREGSGLARGTVSDFDSHIFMPSGKASTVLKP